MKYPNQQKFFSSLLCVVFIVPCLSTASDQRVEKPSGVVMVNQVSTKVAEGLLTVSLPTSELQHLLSCKTDTDSWVDRCNRCRIFKAEVCSAILISNVSFHPKNITYKSKL